MKIYFLDNGFAYIGTGYLVNSKIYGKSLRIKNALNLRVWGTTNKGLGVLAIEGKQKETIVDFCGIVDVPIGRVFHVIHMTDSAMKSFKDA